MKQAIQVSFAVPPRLRVRPSVGSSWTRGPREGGHVRRRHWRPIAGTVTGAMIVSVPLSLMQAQAPQELRLTRDLRIDAAEHDLTSITPPGGLTVAPDGTIIVSQNQDGTIRFFDANGRSLGTFGRQGQGPGEFQTIVRFTWIGNTLVASDERTRRLTLVSPDRKLVQTVPWLSAASVPARSGADPSRLRVAPPRVRFADGSQLLSVGLPVARETPDWPGGEKAGTPFVVVDSTGTFLRLIAWVPRVQCEVPFDAGGGMSSGSLGVPFCAQTLEAVSPDGGFFAVAAAEHGSNPSFRLTLLRTSGDTVFSRSYLYRPVAIARAARDSAIASRARGDASRREAAAKMPVPDTYPPFDRLLVGRDGTVWLAGFGQGGQRFWNVVNAMGNLVGRAIVPGNIQVMVVSRDVAWAIETGEDGLQSVVRFRVSRP